MLSHISSPILDTIVTNLFQTTNNVMKEKLIDENKIVTRSLEPIEKILD